ncbi:sigma-70 family RNA polymerase sigma factor [Amycolatopsis sp. 195334CR]|uniref:sigma-70 family RNA polymerase sigma factor n=1 Tax=Amycolatopsis sp. 195334CR TaxID=2814588 RepID=UPI001A8D48DC|nr:sigma-70 family RNA polymerase sigma factor [Amycolatopsis sp. 195334CR]MBN6038508.1 sigma-70 family RNA polymerase sigma factor [Amycolatopsis sp. 195334CR]
MGRFAGGRRARPEPGLADEQSLRDAYQAHGAELYRFALRQLHDDGAAQDVVQEVFLRAWRSSERFDAAAGSLRGWLFAIARHVVIDEIRRRTARTTRDAATARTELEPGFDEDRMNAWVVEEALRRISPEHRVALVETYLRGRPYPEVAAEQGIPPGTLRSRLFYGLKSLRVVMEEMGVEP